jgi:hypothetical protein
MDKTTKALRRRVNRARNFPTNTCGASRHLHMMADALAEGREYHMLAEEPEHCACSIYAILASLWETRAQLWTLREKYEPEQLRADHEAAVKMLTERLSPPPPGER